MDILVILGIAIGLAMDALAVSAANGAMVSHIRFRQAIPIAFSFGFFQAMMPVIGWAAGLTFNQYIKSVDHWVAFGLLFLIGGKMIWESFHKPKEQIKSCLHLPTLMLMSIATSIDALAVGLSFAMLETTIWFPVLVIGVVTFILSMIGIRVGKWVGPLFGKRVELLGGIVLIGIGIKILIEHLVGNI